ncbi:MAG: very short patch repair endonuclease [Solirubrobacteraceae bacterium]
MDRLPPTPPASTPAIRTAMQGNRRTGTGPEMAVRTMIHAAGLRYRVDAPVPLSSGKPVRPDLVFRKRRICVFVDGCFWHRCPEHCRIPAANRDYWEAKLLRNQQRDRRTTEALEEDGWTVIRAWEHDDPASVAARVIQAVRDAPASSRTITRPRSRPLRPAR